MSSTLGSVGGSSLSSTGVKRQLDHQASYAQHDNELKGKAALDDVLNFLKPKNDLDVVDEETGLTQLIRACEDNSVSEVNELLSQGAGVNIPDINGRTPLMVASAEGNMDILMILLEFRSVLKRVSSKKVLRHGSDSDEDSCITEPDQSSSFMNVLLARKSSPEKRNKTPDVSKTPDTTEKSCSSDVADENEEPTTLSQKKLFEDDGSQDDESKTETDSITTPRRESKRPSPTKFINQDKSPPRRMSLIGLKNLLKPEAAGNNFETVEEDEYREPDIDIEAKDKYGWTALMFAALCGHVNIVQVLLEHNADVHAVNIKSRTAFHVALSFGHIDVSKLFLRHGVDINRLDRHLWTAAMSACKRGELEAVNFAIDQGAFLSINKHSLLTISATYGHLDLVVCLLEKKVKPSLGLRDLENEEVLFLAAEHKHIQIVQFMLDYGVNINAMNECNQNALLIACRKGHEEIINLLLQRHDDVDDIFHEDDLGYTAFLYAATNNLIQVVKLLISKGVTINSASSKSGIRALMCAATSGHFKLMNLLLDHYGAHMNATDFSKKSALHYSCIGGHAEIADLLIAKGAFYKKDAFNNTPLYYARCNGHFEVAATLEHKYGDKKILMRADLQPVSNCFDITFLTVTAAACYVDIVFDIINAYTFYRQQQYNYFWLAIFFQVIPICAAVTLQKGWGTRFMAIFHMSVVREFYHSIRGKVETPMMCTLRIIETCLEACPSALLQLFVLIKAWLLETKSGHSARGFYGVLPSSQERLLFLSILISIGSTSITFIKFVSSEKDRLLMPVKSIVNYFVDIQPEKISSIEAVYCYHCCEEFFRLLTLAVLFVALKGWALIAIAVSYVLRMVLSTVIFKAENFSECTKARQFIKIFLRIALSQITDSLWYNNFKLTLNLQILTTAEGLVCSMFLLYVDDTDTDTFNFDRIQILLIVGGMTWVLKTTLYLLTYYWMGSEASTVLIVDDDDFGQYYTSSRNVMKLHMNGLSDKELGEEVEVEKNDVQESRKVEEYETHALTDRKNYFSSIMKGVKKSRANKVAYKYSSFPPIFPSEVDLLESIKEETSGKKVGLKHGLDNVQHNEDFHLLFPQFFQAVKKLAPNSIDNMIRSSLEEVKAKNGRVVRSPLRHLFNIFLTLQTRRLLLPLHEGLSHGGRVGVITSSVFPDRVDWVEFVDFVSKVDLLEWQKCYSPRRSPSGGEEGGSSGEAAGVSPVRKGSEENV